MGDGGCGRGATPLFTFADVHVELDGRDVLRGVDVDIPDGALTAIVGPSGSGESRGSASAGCSPAITGWSRWTGSLTAADRGRSS